MIRALIDEFNLEDLDIVEVGGEGRLTMSGFDDDKLSSCKSRIESMIGEAAGSTKKAPGALVPPPLPTPPHAFAPHGRRAAAGGGKGLLEVPRCFGEGVRRVRFARA